MYVCDPAIVRHPAADPDGAAAGPGDPNLSHRGALRRLQEPAPHGFCWQWWEGTHHKTLLRGTPRCKESSYKMMYPSVCFSVQTHANQPYMPKSSVVNVFPFCNSKYPTAHCKTMTKIEPGRQSWFKWPSEHAAHMMMLKMVNLGQPQTLVMNWI